MIFKLWTQDTDALAHGLNDELILGLVNVDNKAELLSGQE